MKINNKSVRWKKEKAETGLSAIGAGPRGYDLHDGELIYARVYPSGGGWRKLDGWYFVVGWDSNLPRFNSSKNLVETSEEAKKQAEEYIQKCLKDGN